MSHNYQHIFTITDSTEKYVTVRFDFETGIKAVTNTNKNILLRNPVENQLTLEYAGHVQIYEINGKLLVDRNINKNEPIDVMLFKSGVYFIKTDTKTIIMIKK